MSDKVDRIMWHQIWLLVSPSGFTEYYISIAALAEIWLGSLLLLALILMSDGTGIDWFGLYTSGTFCGLDIELCPFGGHQNAALCNACAVSADIAAVWTQFCIETLICILTGKYLVLVLLLIFWKCLVIFILNGHKLLDVCSVTEYFVVDN